VVKKTRRFNMGHASTSIDLNVPPDEVWQLIGGFNSLPDWVPFIVKSEAVEGGRVRHLETPKGEFIIERLEKFDQVGRTYTYSVLQAPPSPVTDVLATITVHSEDDGKTSQVEWSGTYTPKGMDEEAQKHLLGIFNSGLTALAKRFSTSQ
jgi:hypothetical protein